MSIIRDNIEDLRVIDTNTNDIATKADTTYVDLELADKVDKVTSTDNAIVRFNGTTGQLQDSGVTIDDSGRVGVGTNNPNNALDVIGEATVGNGTDGVKLSWSTSQSAGVIDTADTSTSLSIRTGNTERMRINSSGIVTMPYQPAFSAAINEHWDTQGDMTFGLNILSDPAWNGTRFTATVAGKYLFSWGGIGLNASAGGGGTARMNICVNGVAVGIAEARADSSQEYDPASSTLVVYLQASDYVTVQNSDNRGWYKDYTYFSGHLIG